MEFINKAICVSFLLASLSSCDKNQSIEPISTQHNDEVKVVNNRLVFSDERSFLKIRDGLWQKKPQELDDWEKNHAFVSVRKLPVMSEKDTIPNLKEEFGFPESYATLINTKGEYQIGDKIYWFNKGFKYQVESEDELKKVKKNPNICLAKFTAGVRLIKREFAEEGNSSNRTTRIAS